MLDSIIYFEENCTKIFEKLENDLLKSPTNLAEYVYGITDELHKLGLVMIKESLEMMDKMIQSCPIRRKNWTVEAHHPKTLTTSLGDVTFQKTLFQNKETKERVYLLDRIMKFEPKQRLTEDAVAEIFKEAVQTSYRRGGEQVSLSTEVSRQTVKNKIHILQFPPDKGAPEQKKVVDHLYIDADEDHVALQFRQKKGDLIKAGNGIKNNGLAAKLVYVYEGKEKSDAKDGRRKLVNCHYFCEAEGQTNEQFWDSIYQYLDQNYDLEQVKKIYMNADGGSWIKAGMKRLAGVTYVLDGFHLEKYLARLCSHLKKEEKEAALEKYRETVKSKTKADFKELLEEQKEKLPEWRNPKKLEEAAGYILSNWMAAKLRLQDRAGIEGSSTESHVSHVLSARMSSRPMGWSRTGAIKMAGLRAYHLNGGDMLELVRFQKKELPESSGKEKEILSSAQIWLSEKSKHGEVGKYVESITHSIPEQAKKMAYFHAHIWGL